MQKSRTIRGYLENHRAIQELLWNNLWVMQELCMNLVRTICGSCKNHVTNHKSFVVLTCYGPCLDHVKNMSEPYMSHQRNM